MTTTIVECPFCGKSHGVRCPEVKAIEYFEDGKVKRVEFMTGKDYWTPMVHPLAPLPTPLPMPTYPYQPIPITCNTYGSRAC